MDLAPFERQSPYPTSHASPNPPLQRGRSREYPAMPVRRAVTGSLARSPEPPGVDLPQAILDQVNFGVKFVFGRAYVDNECVYSGREPHKPHRQSEGNENAADA